MASDVHAGVRAPRPLASQTWMPAHKLGVEDFGCKNIEVIMDIMIFEELAIGLEMTRVRKRGGNWYGDLNTLFRP